MIFSKRLQVKVHRYEASTMFVHARSGPHLLQPLLVGAHMEMETHSSDFFWEVEHEDATSGRLFQVITLKSPVLCNKCIVDLSCS